jgi:hypothetical protein
MRASKTAKRRFSDRMNRWTVAAALALITGSAAVSRAAEPENGDVDVIKLRPSFYMTPAPAPISACRSAWMAWCWWMRGPKRHPIGLWPRSAN